LDIDLIAAGDDGHRGIYGRIHLEPGLIPVGWTVEVLPVNETDLQKPKPSTSTCGDSNGEAAQAQSAVVSLAFNLVIRDSKGRKRSLEELLNARKNSSHNRDRLRFGYLRDGDSAWQHLEDNSDVEFEGDFGNATAVTKHLTSKDISFLLPMRRTKHLTTFLTFCQGFAVLLSFDDSGSCNSNVLWIISVSLLSFSVACSVLIVALVYRVPFMKRRFYGFNNGAKTISTIERDVTRINKQPTQEHF